MTTGIDLSFTNTIITQAISDAQKKQVAEAEAFFSDNAANMESSTYTDLFNKFKGMKQTGNYSEIQSLMGLLEEARGGVNTQNAARDRIKTRQDLVKGRTNTLLGGQRYEQLLTKETIKQQEIGTKPKGTLLTEDTIMATNKKAGI